MIHPSRKARGDSKLKMLPDALQEELFQFLRRHTQEKTLAWLLEKHALSSSGPALSGFFDWYPRSLTLRMAAASADQLARTLTKIPELKIKAEQARQVAQISFEIQAAQDRDPALFSALRKGELESARLTLEREKHEWAKKTDVEKALDALHTELKADPAALDLWGKLSARLAKLAETREGKT